MSINDFIFLCCEPGLLEVSIFSLEEGSTIWTGRGNEIPSKFVEAELCSFDIPAEGSITLNIE